MKKIFFRLFFLGGMLLSMSCLCNSAFSQGNSDQPINVVIITVDTLRADRVGCYGYRRIKTPQIDALASEGILFEKAFTPVPTTLPAHTSLFTGTYPLSHGLRHNGTFALTDSANTLAEAFKSAGYTTAAFVSSFVLDSRFGLDQGFDLYDDDLITGVDSPTLVQKERRAETVTKATIKWLESTKKASPFFLWLHYYDPHEKYDPPSPFAEAYAHSLYDGEIAYTDSWIGIFINKLKEMGIYEQTLLILASDHGESLGEHQEDTHGIFIYDSTIHVPMIFRYPARLTKGVKIPSLVRLIDIAPTVLALTGQNIPAPMQGMNLLPLIEGKEKDPGLTLYCETEYPKFTYGWSPLEGLRTETHKYIRAPESELYDLGKDPKEEKNLVQQEKDQAEKYQREFNQLKEKISSSASGASSKSVVLDQSAREKLKSLGYLVAPAGQKTVSATYPDPKAMIGLLAHFKKGAEYLGQNKYEEAVAEFKEVLKKDPKNIDVFTCLGAVYQSMGKPDLAITAYREAVSLAPDHLDNLLQLGNLYLNNKKPEEAKAIFEQALHLNEKCKEAYLNLGIYYIGKEAWPEAKTHLEKALIQEPGYVLAQNHLVSVYYKLGETDRAISLAQGILANNPKEPSALYNLGSIYMDQKKYNESLDAFRKLTEALPSSGKGPQYMGMIYYYQQSFDKAVEGFQEAAKREPKWADPHLNLGILYAQYKQDYRKALKEFEAVLQIDPQNALARQFMEQTQRTLDKMTGEGSKKD